MNQFHWQGSQTSNNKGATTVSTSPSNASGDLNALKIQPAQAYAGKIQTITPSTTQAPIQSSTQSSAQNMVQAVKTQVQLSLPQINGQTVTVNQPLPQLPQGFSLNQQVQVVMNLSKTGQLTLTLTPAKNHNQQNKQTISTSNQTSVQTPANNTATPPQTVKISLSDSQLLSLLTLNKAFSSTKNTGQGKVTNNVIQTQAPVTTTKGQLPQIKLPGLNTPIKLPDNIASLLQGQKTVAIELKPQGRDIQLQITLPKGGQVSTAITAEKLTPIIKQALSNTSNQNIKVESQNTGDKVTLANNQSLNLAGKTANLAKGEAQIKFVALHAGQLTVQITGKEQAPVNKITIDIPAQQINSNIKQALQTANKQIAENPQLDADIPVTAPTTKNNADMQVQKQALQQFIDPLIRLLLPKKTNWNEGFKTLAAIEQSISNKPQATANSANANSQINQQQSNNNTPIDLKQILTQVKQAIPDHNSPLDEKTINTMVSEILNFSPTKTATPSVQPTPANAIASALQLLLGAKVSQGEAKLSTQLQQQIQQLIKPLATKAPTSEAGLKNITQTLANNPSAEGALKTLAGIQSNIRHQQVENIEKRVDGNNQLEFNLPLRIDNQVKDLHIAINEEKHNSETSTSRLSIWNLNLTFDLNDLGKLLVNAKLKDGEVSISMYAEQPKTLALMNKFSATLEQRLEFHGVKINNIQSSLGKINPTNSKRQLNSLVQIKV